jgi:hypothetical protein
VVRHGHRQDVMRRTVVSVFDGDVFHRSQTAQALGRLSVRLTTRTSHYCIVDTTFAHSTVRNDLAVTSFRPWLSFVVIALVHKTNEYVRIGVQYTPSSTSPWGRTGRSCSVQAVLLVVVPGTWYSESGEQMASASLSTAQSNARRLRSQLAI